MNERGANPGTLRPGTPPPSPEPGDVAVSVNLAMNERGVSPETPVSGPTARSLVPELTLLATRPTTDAVSVNLAMNEQRGNPAAASGPRHG